MWEIQPGDYGTQKRLGPPGFLYSIVALVLFHAPGVQGSKAF
jgi:hypothetical protein